MLVPSYGTNLGKLFPLSWLDPGEAETGPRWVSASTSGLPIAGHVHLRRIRVSAGTYQTLRAMIGAVQGVTLTGTFFAVLDVVTGTQLVTTADLSVPVAAVAPSTVFSMSFTTPLVVVQEQDYWIATLVASAVTMPNLVQATQLTALNNVSPALVQKMATLGQVTIPATIAAGGGLGGADGATSFWYRLEP